MELNECEHCKYKWLTRSGLKQITCPSCMKKTTNQKVNTKEEDGAGGSIKSS